MPEKGDERTELQADAEAAASQPPPRGNGEEATELQPETNSFGEPRPAPAGDGTSLDPRSAGALPELPRPTQPPDERTEAAPAADLRPAPRPSSTPREDLTELQRAPGDSGSAGRLPKVPGYRLTRRLGAGTYGEVWLAEEDRTGIRVAIKFLHHGTGLEWQLVQAEVKQLALLHADPGIVQLLDVELDAAPPYYVMAYAEGGSLAGKLEKGPLPLAEALEVFRQLAEALAYVHAKGVRHCDLKPGNVLLNARSRVLIADFGQAHLSTDAAPALGTFFYMAPEQADLGEQIPDTRWDVYGLGAILYAMLTGRPPRESAEARAALAASPNLPERLRVYREWVRRAPRPDEHRRLPGMDRRLAEIIDRCLEIDPGRRLHDAGAVLAALARRERQRRQRPLLVFGFVAQLVLFLLMGGAAVWAAASGLERSERALVEQVLDSDRVAASLIASGLEKDLMARRQTLERFAHEKALRVATAARQEKELNRLMKEFNRREIAAPVLSWVVAGARGELLAYDLNEKLPKDFKMPRSFAWRDWFNGRGDYLGPDRDAKELPPITQTHVSQPFRRTIKDEVAIGISTPILDPSGKGKVVGVLYTPVRLQSVEEWLDRVKIKDGFAVLVDRRGFCLRHRARKQILPPKGHDLPKWDSETFRAAVAREGSAAEHTDPVDGRVYLASYVPLLRVGWGALVQHDREAALRPVEDLKRQLLVVGVSLLVGVPLLLTGLWSCLIWTLRRKERIAQG
jgi:eukaryotic-like serine/threonine-protein kinase